MGDNGLNGEAVATAYLKGDARLDDSAIQTLAVMGWAVTAPDPNYTRTWPDWTGDHRSQVVEDIVGTLMLVYEMPSDGPLDITTGTDQGDATMQFGFTLKPDHTLERTLALTRQAEAAGFDYGWLFDSHVLWREPYVLLTLMAQATTRLRLGTCVTNPATREPSVTASALAVLNEVSGGRMDLGIGRGDSARRVLGKPPTTMATLEEAIVVIKALVEGRTIEYEGTELHLSWTGPLDAPVWVAGYGPMALAMTGRVADGIILQLADPDLIRWFVGQVREAADACGARPRVHPRPGGGGRVRRPARARPGADPLVPGARLEPRRRPRQQVPARPAAGEPDRLHPGSIRLRLPAPRRGRLVECGVRRRRGDGPVLRPGLGRGARRQAARAGRRRRGPVQHLPHERRRGSPARGVRTRRHPGASRVA